MKFLKDLLTEADNQTFCLMRVGGFAGLLILVVLTVYTAIHYGVASGMAFDPAKVSATLASFCDSLFKILGSTAGAVAVKAKLGGDSNGG